MNLPFPPVPADCDLTDFAFMPLDVRRLRDSDLASDETPECCWAAVLLWCASWHQVPAASVPDNDQWLAKQAGYVSRGKVAKEWAEVRDGALRGWVKCSDGRLYHPVVAEKALEAWQSKLHHTYGKACDRLRKENKRRQANQMPELNIPVFEEWVAERNPAETPNRPAGIPPENDGFPPERAKSSAGIPPENLLKGQGQGQGEVNLNPIPPSVTEPSTAEPTSAVAVCDIPDPPTNPAHWLTWFNREQGTCLDPSSQFDRKGVWPVFTRWCKEGITQGQVVNAIRQAHETKSGPIANLPKYVDSVMANNQAPQRISHSDQSKLAAARAIFGTGIEENHANPSGNIIDVTPTTRSLGG